MSHETTAIAQPPMDALASETPHRPPVKPPEHIQQIHLQPANDLVPPEVKLPDPTKPLPTPTPVPAPQLVKASEVAEAVHAKPKHDASLVVLPNVMKAAEKNLFAQLLHKIDPQLHDGLTMTMSNELSSGPATDRVTEITITIKGPMVGPNYALLSTQFLHAMRDHTIFGAFLKKEGTNTLDHIPDTETGRDAMQFHLQGLTIAEYAHFIQALAKSEQPAPEHKAAHHVTVTAAPVVTVAPVAAPVTVAEAATAAAPAEIAQPVADAMPLTQIQAPANSNLMQQPLDQAVAR